jgi:hypothetical protein
MHRSKSHLYSITSSARSRIEVGNSIPIALAILRLRTNWNFDARSIGRSAGLAEYEFEFGGLDHRKVGRPLAFENPPGVDAGLAICVGYAGAVAHQATGDHAIAPGIARRQRWNRAGIVSSSQCR